MRPLMHSRRRLFPGSIPGHRFLMSVTQAPTSTLRCAVALDDHNIRTAPMIRMIFIMEGPLPERLAATLWHLRQVRAARPARSESRGCACALEQRDDFLTTSGSISCSTKCRRAGATRTPSLTGIICTPVTETNATPSHPAERPQMAHAPRRAFGAAFIRPFTLNLKSACASRKAHARSGISGHRVTSRRRPKGQLDPCPRRLRWFPMVGGASWLGLPGLPSSTTTRLYSRH
jgi:hypothetical protein